MSTASSPMRFVALDIHRKYLVVGAVDSGQQMMPFRKLCTDKR